MGRLGLGLGLGKVRLGALLNLIPNKADALFWLDGVILDESGTKYFRDKTGNGRKFLITGYDFDSTWLAGMPYKSTATISAPVGDATLIAGDINNYLYTAGTPNQIPVVSLFQDIDYEHKLFCRHFAQVIDGNGVETNEPRVLDIVLYNTIKISDELTNCQEYFGVPVEVTSAVRWIDPVNGLDTNSGTKSLPWKTLPKCTSSATNGDTIYIRSGICDITSAWDDRAKTLTYISVGFNTMKSSVSRASFMYPGSSVYKGLNFLGTGITDIAYSLTATNPQFINCSSSGATQFINNNSSGLVNIKNCVIYGYTYQALTARSHVTVDTCYLNKSTSTGISLLVGGNNVVLKNSRLNTSNAASYGTGGGSLVFGTATFVGNTGNCRALLDAYDAGTIQVKNNVISTLIYVINLSDTTPIKTDVTISNNTINSVFTGGSIKLTNKNLIVTNNILNHNSTSGTLISLIPITTTDSITVDISNNVINTINQGSPIEIGDSTFVTKNKISGSIKNNKAYCSGTGASHGVCIWANNNIEIAYNRIENFDLSIVLKGGNCDYSSVKVHHNICISGRIVVKGVSNTPIYNNVLISSTKSLIMLDFLKDEVNNEAINTQVKNNIIINNTPSNSTVFINIEDASTLVSDYNLFYNDQTYFAIKNSSQLTFTAWQALGYDANSVLMNDTQLAALFTDITNYDCAIPVGSLAIGSGVTLDAGYDDGLDTSTVWGTITELASVITKQQGESWDVGAYVQ